MAFIEKAWEAGIELDLKPAKNEITVYSGLRKYETIKVATEADVEELVSYLTGGDDVDNQ